MKVVILAGGMGSRISEETESRPKPMVEIGGKPIIWHIMKIYSEYGFNDFVVCLGYKGYVIREFFFNYYLHMSDVTVDLKNNTTEIHKNQAEPWRITMVDTGESTMTGGRIARIKRFVDGERFMLTYGDGLSNIDMRKLNEFHQSHGKIATVTAIQPPGRFGSIDIDQNMNVRSFIEKPRGDGAYVNGGFFILEPEVFSYIDGDQTIWERGPLQALSRDNQLMAFKHDGFWYAMDTLRDKNYLDEQWTMGKAPWKVWD
jgi:glucose-1-phosphate cytidylyltransferase